MAKLGLMTSEFPTSAFQDTLDAIAAAGAKSIQLDLVSATGETFPEELPAELAQSIRSQIIERNLELAALSGTYNMIHPDIARREAGRRATLRVIEMAQLIGAPVVTLCTGTRDTDDMWRAHPANDSPDAWRDLINQLGTLLQTAEANSVVLGVEPEISNTVNSVQKARRLLDDVASPNLKIIMDGANIFQKGTLPRMNEVLDQAFDLLGPDIALAHAKDLDRDGDAGHLPAGKGRLDYRRYVDLLRRFGFEGSIILHSLAPTEAAACLRFVGNAAPDGYLSSR